VLRLFIASIESWRTLHLHDVGAFQQEIQVATWQETKGVVGANSPGIRLRRRGSILHAKYSLMNKIFFFASSSTFCHDLVLCQYSD
jgi:hypothetical protein